MNQALSSKPQLGHFGCGFVGSIGGGICVCNVNREPTGFGLNGMNTRCWQLGLQEQNSSEDEAYMQPI
jgi:hypothetical protein